MQTTTPRELFEAETVTDENWKDRILGYFLAGKNSRRQDCGTKVCPAAAAGYEPGTDESSQVAHEYDFVLREWAKEGRVEVVEAIAETSDGVPSEFVVSEEQAREAWFQAIRNLKSGDPLISDQKDEDWRVKEEWYECGEEIARKLDWLGEGETVEVEDEG